MNADDFTNNEIARALVRLEKSLSELRGEVRDLAFVRQDVWAVERDALKERIDTVAAVADASNKETREDLGRTQENLRWLVRAVLGVVFVVVVTALLAAAGIRP